MGGLMSSKFHAKSNVWLKIYLFSVWFSPCLYAGAVYTLSMMKIELNKIAEVEFDGVNHNDAPDYVDAYISKALIKDGEAYREATEKELDFLNSDEVGQWRYEKLLEDTH